MTHRILEGYIFTRLVLALVVFAVGLTAIIWLSQSLRFVDLIVNRGLDATTFLYLSALLLPSLLGLVLPMSVFLSIVFVYNRLNTESELIALKSLGLSPYQLARPALLLAIFATIASYTIALYFLPTTYREFKNFQSFLRDNFASIVLQEGVFNNPAKGIMVYVRESTSDGSYLGILVHDNRNLEKPVTMMAEEGKLLTSNTGPRMVLVNGNRQQLDLSTGQLAMLYFDRYSLELSLFTEQKGNRWMEPQERYLHELFFPTDTRPDLLQKLRAEGHHRITWAFYNIVLALVGLSVFLSGHFNRRGNNKRVAIITLFAFLMMVVAILFYNAAGSEANYVPLMYGNIVFGLLMARYFTRTAEPFGRFTHIISAAMLKLLHAIPRLKKA